MTECTFLRAGTTRYPSRNFYSITQSKKARSANFTPSFAVFVCMSRALRLRGY